MAIGDAAAAAGFAVFSGTQDRRLGYQNDNQRGDELAGEKTARIAADALKVDKNLFKVQSTDPGHVEGRVWIQPI